MDLLFAAAILIGLSFSQPNAPPQLKAKPPSRNLLLWKEPVKAQRKYAMLYLDGKDRHQSATIWR